MRLEHLKATNFRSHANLDLDLSGVEQAAIVGPNGAGKSTILLAIEWALFGTAQVRGDNLSPDALIMEGASEGGVQLTFSVRDRRWRVTRSRVKGKKPTLLVEQAVDGGWSPIKRNTVEESQQIIDGLIGLTVDQFRASIYAPQAAAGMLASMTPGKRKELLGSLLGLEMWDVARELAAAEERDVAAQAAAKQELAAAARLEADGMAVEDLDALQAAREQAVRRAEKAKAAVSAAIAHQQTVAAWQRYQQIEREKQQVAQRALTRRKRQELVEQRREQAAALERELAGAEGAKQALEQAEQAYETERQRKAEADAARAQYRRQRERAEKDVEKAELRVWQENEGLTMQKRILDEHREQEPVLAEEHARVCPTCRQELADEEARAAVVADHEERHARWLRDLREYEQAIPRYEEALDRARMELARAKDELARLAEPPAEYVIPAEAAQAVAEARQRAQKAISVAGELRAVRAALEADEQALAGERTEEQLREEYLALVRQQEGLPQEDPGPGVPIDTAREQEAMAVRAVEDIERRIAQARALAEQQAAKRAQADECERFAEQLRERALALETAKRAFSRDGVQAMILDNALERIEEAANEALRRLGGDGPAAGMRISLRTQVELKSGKGQRETLEIVVDDGTYERPLSTFSGGEAYRVHIALRLGLAQVLSDAMSGLLLIDEPTDLDDAGIRVLADMLRNLGGQVLLVTHNGDLVAGMPQSIRLSRPSMLQPSEVTVS